MAPARRCGEEAAVVEHSEVHDTEGVIALPGANAVLRCGWALAIVTSCSTALAGARLNAAALPIPELLISSDGLRRGKPDPECFAPAGIAAGRAAGAKVLALRTTHPDLDLREADAIVDNLEALSPADASARAMVYGVGIAGVGSVLLESLQNNAPSAPPPRSAVTTRWTRLRSTWRPRSWRSSGPTTRSSTGQIALAA